MRRAGGGERAGLGTEELWSAGSASAIWRTEWSLSGVCARSRRVHLTAAQTTAGSWVHCYCYGGGVEGVRVVWSGTAMYVCLRTAFERLQFQLRPDSISNETVVFAMIPTTSACSSLHSQTSHQPCSAHSWLMHLACTNHAPQHAPQPTMFDAMHQSQPCNDPQQQRVTRRCRSWCYKKQRGLIAFSPRTMSQGRRLRSQHRGRVGMLRDVSTLRSLVR